MRYSSRVRSQILIYQVQEIKNIEVPMPTPLQVGDAMLGQVCEAMIFVADHVAPSMTKYMFHWETDDVDLGPIMPEFGSVVEKKDAKTTDKPKPGAPMA
ncbi:hypothetical protein Poli38472_008174 [Pythium oligandrum]|uniref:Uncharacterized protein n=1 Tax=Pythium oligandrum TaxID=41045 RepID=A0A8K1CNB7_PYTOL|nr:hypothetical protein Poli38472_008174 [Pythium oligandrum]|eukprot:TMW65532.1 hypothetical protein Poli38472_008174 [Pythium oligandrum]